VETPSTAPDIATSSSSLPLLEEKPPGFARRWWIYQRERFPLLAHGPLIAAFSFCAVSFSALLRGAHGWPAAGAIVVAFANSFCAFLQLRLADEFKDLEEDTRYRPYRPVPRGLVTLRQLGWLWAGSALVQASLALWLDWRLLGWLALTWLYLAGMSKEFFVRDWLKARPVTYLWTHMLIMPLIDFYATACDWLPALGGHAPHGLGWFVATSFCNGIVIEIGRKLRAPEAEEIGVPTYTAQWGRPRAVAAWLGALAATLLCAGLAARRIGFVTPVLCVLGVLLSLAAAASFSFLKKPVAGRAKAFEPLAGVWTLALYLMLGAVPLAIRLLGTNPP